MLKILLLSPWLPWPPHDGARIRILETIRYLSTRHELTFLANVASEEELRHVEPIRNLCKEVHVEPLSADSLRRIGRLALGMTNGFPIIQSLHYNRSLAHKLAVLTAQQRFDIVQMELSLMGRYANAISPKCDAKRVLATHNIETQRYQRELELTPWNLRRMALTLNGWLFPDWESKLLGAFDGAIAVSESDADWLRLRMPREQVCLVPNGVDTVYFRQREAASTANSLVFTGVMDYPPNIDAVVWFVETIFPRLRARFPGVRFDIVGAKPSARVLALREHESVNVTGEVPDIRPYVEQALAFIVPLRSGGGTRLKILQAMALGCPVISTRVGAEGIAVSDGNDILFADDANEFMQQIERLFDSPDLRADLGNRGRDLVTRHYDWQACLSRLDSFYSELLGSNGK